MADESDTARAVREAQRDLAAYVAEGERVAALEGRPDNYAGPGLAMHLVDYDAKLRADERAVLARAVPPMTWTAKAGPGVLAEDVFDRDKEYDALRAALTARDAEIATLRRELDAHPGIMWQELKRDLAAARSRAEKAEADLSRERERRGAR